MRVKNHTLSMHDRNRQSRFPTATHPLREVSMDSIMAPSKSESETFVADRKVIVCVGMNVEYAGIDNHSIRWLTAWAWKRANRPLDAIITVFEEPI